MDIRPIKKRRRGHCYSFKNLVVSFQAYQMMRDAGITDNLAIRTPFFMVNGYSTVIKTGMKRLVSVEARHLDKKDCILEHGAPRTGFTRLFIDAWREGKLTEEYAEALVHQHFAEAIITREEDQKLTRLGFRSKLFDTPYARWKAAGIEFSEGESWPQAPRLP